MQAMTSVCYLLHFDTPLGNPDNPRGQAQHYLGWTPYLPARIAAHLAGRGARLTQVAHERGIGFVIARTWPGDRSYERRLKRRKEGPKLCPICRQAARTRNQLTLDLEDDLL